MRKSYPRSKGRTERAALYFQFPCFDGLISCLLAWDFLESAGGWKITRFRPVNYDIRDKWIATRLDTPCAVVDFLYHPRASFWADHHLTTFLTAAAKADFERRKRQRCLLFDGRARSCAGLMWNRLRPQIPGAARYEEMVSWADKIDSATYSSVHEAVLGDAPALRISRSLMLTGGADYARLLLRALHTGDLESTARLEAVRTRLDEVQRRVHAGLKRVEKRAALREGEIAVFDIQPNEDELISRYAPYYFFPDARYSIGIVRLPMGVRLTAMRNPWRNFKSVSLGNILARFGGGGHQRVGSLVLEPENADRLPEVMERLLAKMRSSGSKEGVTA